MTFVLDREFKIYNLVHTSGGKNLKYYVEWYEAAVRQMRRRSLKTGEWDVAMDKIHRILRSGITGDPKSILDAGTFVDIKSILEDDYTLYGSKLASAGQTRTAINHLNRHIGGIRIDAWTRRDFRKFENDFLALGYQISYLSRICTVLRAALNRAEGDEKIVRAPKIPEVCTDAHKDAAPLKGRLMTPKEIAQLIDQVHEVHLLDYLIAEINTASRGVTILESDTNDIDWSYPIFDMNPTGRVQTKKYRPTVRISKTWEPWLKQAPLGRLITYAGNPVKSVKKAFRAARKDSGLKPDSRGVGVSTYSIRHSLGRYLEDCGVPDVERSILLGHVRINRKKTTDRYSPFNPRGPLYLVEATKAIEKFVREINEHTKKWNLLVPYAKKEEPTAHVPRTSSVGEASSNDSAAASTDLAANCDQSAEIPQPSTAGERI
jgi:hypothetical protein